MTTTNQSRVSANQPVDGPSAATPTATNGSPSTPSDDELNPDNLFTDVTLRGPAEILERLGTPTELDERFRAFDDTNAREFYVYRCLLEVQKAGTTMVRWRDFAKRRKGSSEKDRLNAFNVLSLESFIAEQCVWQRRLAEILFRLIGFSTTNEPIYYEHLLRATELEELFYDQIEQRNFFGSESASARQRAEELAGRLEGLGPAGHELEKAWYVHPEFERNLRRRRAPLLASANSLARMALHAANAGEKRALGYSYRHAFSAPSATLHFSILPEPRELDESRFNFCWIQLGFLAMAILTRAQDLLGVRVEKGACRIARNAMVNAPTTTPFQDVATVGDFVVVMPAGPERVFIAEVMQVHRSEFGNESYRVMYLDERPWDVEVDDVMPDIVHGYLKRDGFADHLREELRRGLKSSDPNPEATLDLLMQDSDGAIRNAVLLSWTLGLRDYYSRQAATARAGKRRPGAHD